MTGKPTAAKGKQSMKNLLEWQALTKLFETNHMQWQEENLNMR
jgi:hypothetical protein